MIADEKKLLRGVMKEKTHEFCRDTAQKKRAEQQSCALLTDTVSFRDAEYVLAYSALPDEADCSGVVTAALRLNKTVAFPRVEKSNGEMIFCLLDPGVPLSEQLTEGAFGIMEPRPACRILEPGNIGGTALLLIIVPGLAFSRDGKRLGRGKGFYDRYLRMLSASECRFSSSGFCFGCQMVNAVPADSFDKPVDMVVSEAGLFTFHRASAE